MGACYISMLWIVLFADLFMLWSGIPSVTVKEDDGTEDKNEYNYVYSIVGQE